jgi:hypothetical protein
MCSFPSREAAHSCANGEAARSAIMTIVMAVVTLPGVFRPGRPWSFPLGLRIRLWSRFDGRPLLGCDWPRRLWRPGLLSGTRLGWRPRRFRRPRPILRLYCFAIRFSATLLEAGSRGPLDRPLCLHRARRTFRICSWDGRRLPSFRRQRPPQGCRLRTAVIYG